MGEVNGNTFNSKQCFAICLKLPCPNLEISKKLSDPICSVFFLIHNCLKDIYLMSNIYLSLLIYIYIYIFFFFFQIDNPHLKLNVPKRVFSLHFTIFFMIYANLYNMVLTISKTLGDENWTNTQYYDIWIFIGYFCKHYKYDVFLLELPQWFCLRTSLVTSYECRSMNRFLRSAWNT